MDKMDKKDTIAAIATGSSAGGLGVIRISGQKAKEILTTVFRPRKAARFTLKPRYMHYGSFILKNKGQKELLDEILAVYFPAPHSYTGEDVAEIHAHGSNLLLHAMLDYILSLGIRQAEAGEFTKRAFLNGRLDLSQAEAVAEIISAPSVEGLRLAAAKLHGRLGQCIEDLRTQIEYIRRRLCLAIDFPEEEGECLPHAEFHALVGKLQTDIEALINAYDRAKPWQEGALVVLAGQVNAGKSSLMNALLGRERAIVTDQAGTTRDYLEEATSLAGLPVRLTDTAGLREIAWIMENYQNKSAHLDDERTKEIIAGISGNALSGRNAPINPIEAEGLCRSLSVIEKADIVFLVFDGNAILQQCRKDTDEIYAAMQAELSLLPSRAKTICIWNKADIAPLAQEELRVLEEKTACPVLSLCAREKKQGTYFHHSIDDLARKAHEMLIAGNEIKSEIAPNRRQAKLLQNAYDELALLQTEIDFLPPDITAIRLESAAQFLSAITGLCGVDETFNAIFEEFCIGK